MCPNSRRNTAQIRILFAGLLLCITPAAVSAELKPETVKAWRAYIDVTEQRIEHELKSENRFLVLDFLDKDKGILERKKLLAGDITIDEMESRYSNGRDIKIPEGKIHHWRGGIFIPGVNLDFVLSRVEDPGSADMLQEDVLESRVLERLPEGFRLFLKLQRSKIVTVLYNTEHRIRFKQHSPLRASSSSVATKIAEVEQLDGNREREKPEGQDHGFLWRMNSYWRYEQTKGGVIVECESVTLSRSVPALLKYMISPIINRIAKESLERTLQSMRIRMTQAMEAAESNALSITSTLPVEIN